MIWENDTEKRSQEREGMGNDKETRADTKEKRRAPRATRDEKGERHQIDRNRTQPKRAEEEARDANAEVRRKRGCCDRRQEYFQAGVALLLRTFECAASANKKCCCVRFQKTGGNALDVVVLVIFGGRALDVREVRSGGRGDEERARQGKVKVGEKAERGQNYGWR